MRKETTARLLLSLLTAFIMVAGALGAALPGLISQTGESSIPTVVGDEAGRELELEMGETGDAPVSVHTGETTNQVISSSTTGNIQGKDNGILMPYEGQREEIIEEPTGPAEPLISDVSTIQGTRNPDTLDAGGPYGTGIPFDPMYEGDPITFDASIEPADEQDSYKFRWDWDNDGIFDGPGDASTDFFGEDGESSFTHTVYDDYQGVALVQAWDGSWIYTIYEGIVMDESDDNAYWSISGDYFTWGWQFEVTMDCTVDKLGWYENIYGDPGEYLAVNIWDDTPTKIAEVANPSMPGANNWGWGDLAIPVDLSTDTTYMITAYTFNTWGYMCAETSPPSETPDGVVQVGAGGYAAGDNYPTGGLGGGIPMIDFHYSATTAIPNVIEDTAKVLVWNREPIVYDPFVSPTDTREGSMDAEFSAWMMDIGLEDEWEYQWDFGDGTQSPWLPIHTWTEGISVLFAHTLLYGTDVDAVNSLREAIGTNWLKQLDSHALMDTTTSQPDIPTLEELLEYDVVVFATNYFWTDPTLQQQQADDWGDVVADYIDAGGGFVIEMFAHTMYSNDIDGRFVDNGYYPIERTSTNYYGVVTSGWYDPTHPILKDYDPWASSSSTYTGHGGPANGAYEFIQFTNGYCYASAFDEDTLAPDSGRVVGLNSYPYPSYNGGDWLALLGNSVKWASQKTVEKLYQPYQLPPISHIYKDDYPEHLTPSDQFQPMVRVRDDDHCHDRVLGDPVIVPEDFNGAWGPWGDNPPPGWTIENYVTFNPQWDYNDWHRYSYSTLGGYVARVYYSPDEDQDEELISPEIDISGYSTVTIQWDQYWYDYYNEAQGDIDYRLDGGSWITGESYSGGYGLDFDEEFDVTTGGASTLEVRVHFIDWGSNYKYWYFGTIEVISGGTTIFEEDWDGSWGTYGDNPPAGWTILDHGSPSSAWGYSDWHKYDYGISTSYGGDGTPCARISYSPYGPQDDWLITPEFDLTIGGLTSARMQFNHWVYQYYYISWMYLKYRVDDGSGYGPWLTLDTWGGTADLTNYYDVEHYDLTFAIGKKLQIAFHRYGTNEYNYYYWYVDNFLFEAIPELRHVYGMSEWVEGQPVTVTNVMPEAINAKNVELQVNENSPMAFEGFQLVDPAFGLPTESFWYRWNFDDGTPLTDWEPVEIKAPTEYKVLVMQTLQLTGTGDPYWGYLRDAILSDPMVTVLDNFNFIENYQNPPTLAELQRYNVIIYSMNYAYNPNFADYAGWVQCRETIGDTYADYLDSASGGIITQIGGFDSLAGQDYWRILGRWEAEDYAAALGPQDLVQSTGILGTIHNPSHPVMDGVSAISTLLHSGNAATAPGGERLADFLDGTWAAGVKDNYPGRVVSQGIFAQTTGADFGRFMSNSIRWAGIAMSPVANTQYHNFMDNGIYYVHLQVIDDDMWWDDSSGQPVFVGPNMDPDNPGADPMDWIGGTVFPVEILNTDPVISPRIKAYAELDLSLRMSGTKTHEATMTLYENGVDIGYTEVTREPGAPNIGVISNVDLMVTKDFEYEIVITVDPQGGGGSNPTWLFDMVFPDGKFKEFKHTFNDEHGWTWTISSSELKGALLGHDIIFEAEAEDSGSDDLAFVWNFGDSTPHGIHLYANVDQGTAVDAVSDEATVLFDQLPNRDEWFDKPANTIRTPDGNAIYAVDMISHVFDENQPYYYYVTIVVMDDDVGDDYPATQLHSTPGMDVEVIEVDFR